jgi:hypothetical protein
MSNNFKDSIKKNIVHGTNNKIEIKAIDTDVNTKFQLGKKKEDKTNKKAFNVYMDDIFIKELDKVGKRSGYSRNELVNKMCQWCLDNLEFKE